MARGRMLNKTVCASGKFQKLSSDACRLFATWTIAHLDINGVFYGDPVLVKALVFPRREDVSVADVEGYMTEMESESVGLIFRFEAKGETWQCWPGFAGEQIGIRRDRETTKFPLPPDIPQVAGERPANGGTDAGELPAEEKRREVKSSEENIALEDEPEKEICDDCLKPFVTGPLAKKTSETCSCKADKELEEILGPAPKKKPVEPAKHWSEHLREKRWLEWHPEKVRPRSGISAESLQRVGWLINECTGLRPIDGEWGGWMKALEQIYRKAEGDFDCIEQGIIRAWTRQPGAEGQDYRPRHPRGFVNEVGLTRADRQKRAAPSDRGDLGAAIAKKVRGRRKGDA